MRRVASLPGAMLVLMFAHQAAADMPRLHITTPMSPPEWALLERELLRSAAAACREFSARYVDPRGYLMCVERWGGDDGPDDAIECFADWPLLHAHGADDDVLRLYKQAWEGHLRQYTEAKTVEVEMARDGMYFREFPTSFDWVHNGEGLTAFVNQGLSDPYDELFTARVQRFADFYLGDDPTAANYDRKHRIIRSMFNGSRGPLLRRATGLDWAGDPIEVEGRFRPLHGERTYEEMVAHFRDYNDIIGDHPQNLCATSLATLAFARTAKGKYRDWVLEYAGAWVERMEANGGIIPTNIGLDGTIGGAADGRWYGGVYGWGFTVEVPQTGEPAHRNTHHLGLVGFGHAYLLSGERRYVDPWREQIELINAQARMIDGQQMYPRMYGDGGWYAWQPAPYSAGARQLYYWSQDPADRSRLEGDGWLAYLEGSNPDFPAAALRGDLEGLRSRVAAMRADTTTPDTRLADDPMMVAPSSVSALTQLCWGGLYPGHTSSLLHARLRYFDPAHRRAGMPDDVAALVEAMTADQVVVTLVNCNPVYEREVIVQGGAYGEHELVAVKIDGSKEKSQGVAGRHFAVRLAPGSGARLVINQSRYALPLTLEHPWNE